MRRANGEVAAELKTAGGDGEAVVKWSFVWLSKPLAADRVLRKRVSSKTTQRTSMRDKDAEDREVSVKDYRVVRRELERR